MLLFLLKASLVIAIFLAFYKALLERESFFSLNRIYLLTCLGLAVALPFFSLPKLIDYQGYLTNWAEKKSTKTVSISTEDWEVKTTVVTHNPQQNEIDDDSREESTAIIPPPPAPTPPPLPFLEESNRVTVTNSWSWQGILIGIYAFGVLILIGNLVAQIISILIKVRRAEDVIEADGSILINLEEKSEPCSFFHYIFIHPDSYDFDTYEQIVAHEKIHVAQRHSWDLLAAEIAVAFLWFNPFIWLLRREIEKNIEYQTDYLLTQSAEQTVKKDYQLNLVKIAANTHPLSVTTNYNQSLIKQRILKMNAKQSNPYSYWKYAFVLPLLVGISLAMNSPISTTQSDDLVDTENETSATTATTLSNNDEAFDELMQAIRDNDYEKVKQLLQEKINIQQADKEGFTPLLLAAQLEHNEIAQLITNEHLESVGFHFDFNEDAEEKMAESDKSDFELLMRAIKEGETDFVEYFLEKEIDLDQEDKDGFTPLIMAASENHPTIAYLLIQKGATVDYINRHGWTALTEAADEGSYETALVLIEAGADVNNKGKWGHSPLYMAASEGNAGVVELLLENGADITSSNALHAAAEEGKPHIIRFLIEQGIDVNLTDEQGRTPLMFAAEEGHLDIVQYLVAMRAEINPLDNGNHSALIYAVGEGNTDIVQYLLDKGAEVVVVDHNALEIAIQEGDEETFDLLLEQQVENNPSQEEELKRNYDFHFFIEAVEDGNMQVVRNYIRKKGDVNAATKDGWTGLIEAADESNLNMVRLLTEAGANVNLATKNGWTPLMEAIDERDISITRYLIRQGANVNASSIGIHNENYYIDNEQFLYSVQNGWSALFEAIDEEAEDIAKYLLDNGADVNAPMQRTYQSKQEKNWTPLMEAAVRGQLDMVQLLFIHYGATKNAKTSSGLTATTIARQAGHAQIADFLDTQ